MKNSDRILAKGTIKREASVDRVKLIDLVYKDVNSAYEGNLVTKKMIGVVIVSFLRVLRRLIINGHFIVLKGLFSIRTVELPGRWFHAPVRKEKHWQEAYKLPRLKVARSLLDVFRDMKRGEK